MLIYVILTLVVLILILFSLAIVLKKQMTVNPVDRMMSQSEGVEPSLIDKEETKHVRWSYKLSTLLFQKKSIESKPDANKLLLAQADIEMTSEEFLLLRLLFTAALAIMGYSVWRTIPIALTFGVGTWFAPRIVMHFRIVDKQRKFDAQLLDAMAIISNALRAGYSFFQALSSVVEETEDPLSKEFKIMLKEMSFGLSLDHAFTNLLQRIYTEDLKLVTICVLIQRDVGGNLSELLDNIGETIRERQKLNGELRALTAQGRMSGMVVVGLPIAMAGALYMLNREYIMLLVNHPVGNVMIAISVVLQVVGIVIINKIIKVEL